MNEPGKVVAERDRSIVTREDGVVRKRYRRPDPRNDVERAAYRHLSAYSAPVPRLIDATDDGIVLEAIANVGDYEAALRSGRAVEATRALGRAYAALHDVPPAGPADRAAARGRAPARVVRRGRCRRARPGLGNGGVR